MTVEARFIFAAGIKRTIKVPHGTIAWAERHIAELREIFDLSAGRGGTTAVATIPRW